MQGTAHLMAALAHEEGMNDTALDGVKIFRCSKYAEPGPLCYYQGVLMVGQGRKRVYLDDKVFDYDTNNTLVMTVPMPVECETFATPEEPVLVLVVDIDLPQLNHLIRLMDAHYQLPHDLGESHLPGYFIADNSDEMNNCVVRLLEALQSPLEAEALGQALLQELLFRLLEQPNSAPLYALSMSHTRLSRIDKALSFIHKNYGSSIEVEQLAKLVSMSPSAFHRCFKEVTSCSPIQYLKKIRLNKARDLLQQQGLKVKDAALEVGYESAAQFSREFKRYFKKNPGEIIHLPR